MSIDVWYKPEDIPNGPVGTAVTIGVFDDVHGGRRTMLWEMIRQAKERGLVSMALTFDPHPTSVHSTQNVCLVSTLEDRIDRLTAVGIDAVYVQRYTLDYARTTPREFFENRLVGELRACIVVVGEDVRFGFRNEGDGTVFVKLGEERGIDVTLASNLTAPEGRKWSLAWVRELLTAGDVAGAARILGRRHRTRGEVVHRLQRGRAIGFPTANLMGDDLGEAPADGMYVGWLVHSVEGSCAAEYLPTAISVGTNPHFEGTKRTVEVHILGRSDLNLYEESIAVDFVKCPRPMLSFDFLEGLLDQMDENLHNTTEILDIPTAGRVDPTSVTAV